VLLVPVEQPPRDVERLEVRADDLPPAAAVFADETRPLEDRDVLLHRREAHRVMGGQLGHALLAVDRAAHDVTPGGVTQCAEDAVVVEGDLHDTTIRLYIRARQIACWLTGDGALRSSVRIAVAVNRVRRREPSTESLV
jgi:hypothetical protein